MSTKDIAIAAYDYPLPEERIAKFPLATRDQSKLLLYENGRIGETIFSQLPAHLPPGALLVFNDTRVIHARLHFTLENGAQIEILCLEPLHPQDYQQNFSSTTTVRWKCLIGGNRKWKSGEARQDKLTTRRVERIEDAFAVEFSWADEHLSFGELLAQAGIIPLPPYLNRAPVAADQERYQTIYARAQGSVAAPTAGLHFTEAVFDALDRKGIARRFVTLHVGAGTFKPVKADTMSGHFMHGESIFIHKSLIESILQAKNARAPVIPVGTTSMRTLESLYWYGVQLLQNPAADFHISQWLPYENTAEVPATEALQALLAHLDANGQETLEGDTQLLIAPGYRMGLTDGLITNFHQPRSTLLLLVAALIGDNWRQVYDYALENDFRFLSYGDSSLLLPAHGIL